MWTIGFQPTGCASPVLLRKDGEMLAFAHIPTGAHIQPRFINRFRVGRDARRQASRQAGNIRQLENGPVGVAARFV
jgi:hypothetical protein